MRERIDPVFVRFYTSSAFRSNGYFTIVLRFVECILSFAIVISLVIFLGDTISELAVLILYVGALFHMMVKFMILRDDILNP